MAELVFFRSGTPLLRLPIDRDRFLVGRDIENHLVIPDDDIADKEAVLELRPEGWQLIDASGRGTRLDGCVIRTEAPLTDGAVIHLGKRWTASFHVGHPTAPGETRQQAGHTAVRSTEPLGPRPIRLRWKNLDGDVTSYLNPTDTIGIGQDEDNSIVLQDEYVSAFHARIFFNKSAWTLSDLGSTNGTFVDDVQVTQAVLEPGMRVRVGETELRVEDGAGTNDELCSTDQYGLVTGDHALRAVLEQVTRIGATDATVTVFGESGTGKELIARAVHQASRRAEMPFIPVNCAAISKELMESELFGHERGAFTGANSARSGAFEEANGGTLFLDDVGELPLDVKAKLLRAIELKEIRRVGASKPTTVDVRIVAATNRDLHFEAQSGRFREDLFYRLYVIPLTLPPLRQRKGDILLLAEHFLRVRSPGRPPILSKDAKDKILEHSWPGNVRELLNTIERAILFHREGRIQARDISFPSPMSTPSHDCTIDTTGKTLAEIEKESIRIALRLCGGNRRLTAKSLGIARSTLQNKLKELDLVS